MSSRRAIEVDQFLAHPREKVWRALTDPTLLSRWLMPTDFQPHAGHRFTLDAGPHGLTRCQVIEVDPERLLRISWRNGELDTTVTWRLEREGEGTRLFVVHDGFDPRSPTQRSAYEAMNAGWRGPIVHELESVVASLGRADAFTA